MLSFPTRNNSYASKLAWDDLLQWRENVEVAPLPHDKRPFMWYRAHTMGSSCAGFRGSNLVMERISSQGNRPLIVCRLI